MCRCRSYGHLPCLQWGEAALPGWGLPSLKGIVPPHPGARSTRTLQGWIVVTPTLDPVPETAHLEGYSSSPFCHLLLGKSLHFLESRSHPLSTGGSKAHTEACCTRGRSERLCGPTACWCGRSSQDAGLISKVMEGFLDEGMAVVGQQWYTYLQGSLKTTPRLRLGKGCKLPRSQE